MGITQDLLDALSPNANRRTEAEGRLVQLMQELPSFLSSLARELADNRKSSRSRFLAGYIINNSLDAEDSAKKNILIQQWISMNQSTKQIIKESLLDALHSQLYYVRHSAAQAVAKVASIEIPRREWQDLINKLHGYMILPGASAQLKQATAQALGYVCEEVSVEHLDQDQVNAILTAVVVYGMNETELSPEVRLAAVIALQTVLFFAEINFATEGERNYIMKVVCDAAMSQEVEIRQAAFECLVAIASTYYSHLNHYIEILFYLTANAVKGDEEPVALQAVEFWSAICDQEIALQATSTTHDHFVEKALSSLVPMLLENLLKQKEDGDEEDGAQTISCSSKICLGLIAKTVGDGVIPTVMPFVEANITKTDWHCRVAALIAFGSIVKGLSMEKFAPLVQDRLGYLLRTMSDSNDQVKCAAAWAMWKVFEHLKSHADVSQIIDNSSFPQIMDVLLASCKDVPNVAVLACRAICCLAECYRDELRFSWLWYIARTIHALLSAADADAAHFRLCHSAYEALNKVVRLKDVFQPSAVMGQLLYEIMARLKVTFDLHIISSGDRRKQRDLQALLCGVLAVIILSNKLTNCIINQFAEQIMTMLLQVFACHTYRMCREPILAMTGLAHVLGLGFAKYMPDVFLYLEAWLKNHEDHQVFTVSLNFVNCVSDVLFRDMLPYSERIMAILLETISNPMVHRDLKPRIFTLIGTFAPILAENFESYLPRVMSILQEAADFIRNIGQNDDDTNYCYRLSLGMFDVYSNMLATFTIIEPKLLSPYHIQMRDFCIFSRSNRFESLLFWRQQLNEMLLLNWARRVPDIDLGLNVPDIDFGLD